MQTGQNSIAPANSLPQLGQVRWGSVLMGITALQPQSEPKATPRSTDWCEIGRQGPWQIVVHIAQATTCSFTLARQITFRNKIPVALVLRRPRVDNEVRRWGGSKLAPVSRSGGPVSSGSSPKAALVRMRHGYAAEVRAKWLACLTPFFIQRKPRQRSGLSAAALFLSSGVL